jgi:hypothetical protein
MQARLSEKERSFIAADRLYTIVGFQQASGISPHRIRAARRDGLALPTIEVGRRKFVKGDSGIRYIEQLAALEARPTQGVERPAEGLAGKLTMPLEGPNVFAKRNEG